MQGKHLSGSPTAMNVSSKWVGEPDQVKTKDAMEPDDHQLTHLHAWGLLKQLQEAGKKKVCEAHNGRRWYEDGPQGQAQMES